MNQHYTWPCEGCGNHSFELLMAGHDRMQGVPGTFGLYRCATCGTVAQLPQPGEQQLASFYPANYAPYASLGQANRLRQMALAYGVKKQVRDTLKHVQPGQRRALDVGCGTGEFMGGLQQVGWSVSGIENNPRAVEFTRQVKGLDVLEGSLESITLPAESYDLITFWDVIEHLLNPRRALTEACRIASPSGTLVVSGPNPQSLEARLFKQYWAGWDVPRHLWIFPHTVLKQVLAECGWELQETCYWRGRHWLLALSSHFWLDESRIPKTLQRVLSLGINSLVAQAITMPYFAAVERQALGSIMICFARKKI